MPAATNKQDLLKTHEVEYTKLTNILDSIQDNISLLSLPEDNSPILQIIHHRTHWMKLFMEWYKDGKDGKEVFTPAKGYKWNQLKQYNLLIWNNAKDPSWKSITHDFEKHMLFL